MRSKFGAVSANTAPSKARISVRAVLFELVRSKDQAEGRRQIRVCVSADALGRSKKVKKNRR
jgi:hypothetical protein